MKGNFHVQFGIGGGESDLSADHTETTFRGKVYYKHEASLGFYKKRS